MDLKLKTSVALCVLCLIASMFLALFPIAHGNPDTYGPRIDDLWGRFIIGSAAQEFALMTGVVDAWFDIGDPLIAMELQEAGFTVVVTQTSLFAAFAAVGAPGCTDTLEGIVNSTGYGMANDWTFYDLHWASMVTPGNPYGIGGTAEMIVGSTPTNYHPGYASTTDEWRILGRVFDPLIQLDPYTHHDIPLLATSWTIQPWTAPGGIPGMNITFWLRDDVYWHDGDHYDADDAVWSLQFTADQKIPRASTLWQNMVSVSKNSQYSVSVYHNITNLGIRYDISRWATVFPSHIYQGTNPLFLPEATAHPTVSGLTCLIGTGPYVYAGGNLVLGGYVNLKANRPGQNPGQGVTTQWFRSVEEVDTLLTEMFHWTGDVRGWSATDPNYNGKIDVFDLAAMGFRYGTVEGIDPEYDETCDISPERAYHVNDGRIDMRDIAELSKNWGKQRTYP